MTESFALEDSGQPNPAISPGKRSRAPASQLLGWDIRSGKKTRARGRRDCDNRPSYSNIGHTDDRVAAFAQPGCLPPLPFPR
jgi:hypothetical protein